MSGIMPLQQAFYQFLTSTCGINASLIAWPNISFTPPTTGMWYIPSFLPGIPNAAALGAYAPNRHSGLFQVIVCATLGQGEGIAVNEAERIIGLWKRGTNILDPVSHAVIGSVRRSYRTQGFPSTEPACWQVPVRIEYWADVAN